MNVRELKKANRRVLAAVLMIAVMLAMPACGSKQDDKVTSSGDPESPVLSVSAEVTENEENGNAEDVISGEPADKDAGTAELDITAEMAFEGINNYCHKEYDWSVAKDNPDIMYVTMGEESDVEYQVIFRSYTGAFVNFYVDKVTGITRVIETAPVTGAEEETGTIQLMDYLDK